MAATEVAVPQKAPPAACRSPSQGKVGWLGSLSSALGYHPGICCDECGGSVKGSRYHKVGHDYDLCKKCWKKKESSLAENEKQQYVRIKTHGAKPMTVDGKEMANTVSSESRPRSDTEPTPSSEPTSPPRSRASSLQESFGYHTNSRCDRCGVNPIKGSRFSKLSEDFDLCKKCWKKSEQSMEPNEKSQFVRIKNPGDRPIPVDAKYMEEDRKEESVEAEPEVSVATKCEDDPHPMPKDNSASSVLTF